MSDTPGLEERVAALEAITAKLTEPAILKDCRTDYFRDGLQGGAVRITHLPTGLTAEGAAKAGDLKDLARELAGDLGRMLEEPREATDKPQRSSPPVPPLSPGEIRHLLRECVTVVKPGETLILRVPWTTTPGQAHELQDALSDATDYMEAPFKVLVIPGDELAVAESEGETP